MNQLGVKRQRQGDEANAIAQGTGPSRSVKAAAAAATTIVVPASLSCSSAVGRGATWGQKTKELQDQIIQLAQLYTAKKRENEEVQDAIEEMIASHDADMIAVVADDGARRQGHLNSLAELRSREEACALEKQRALDQAAELQSQRAALERLKDGLREEIVIQTDSLEQLQGELSAQRELTARERGRLEELAERHRLMQNATYGLSGEVKEIVEELESLAGKKELAGEAAQLVELTRRQLYSQCEEMKGTIRVYCRVKGSEPSVLSSSRLADETVSNSSYFCDVRSQFPSEASQEESASPRGTGSASVGSRQTSDSGPRETGQGERNPLKGYFVFPEGDTEDRRSLCVMLSRKNASLTGRQDVKETFTFDRVFDGESTQEAVYAEVEPLVNCAVDGYRVCVFAYGQTGSGKTYSMQGDVHDESRSGITPRALQTIFRREGELRAEGWKYKLTCHFVEIYNDVIRDLLQDPSVYEPGGYAASQPNYHTIKQNSETGSTHITGVTERRINSLSDFQRLYDAAMKNRSTAKTALNDHSSRSHCIFVLNIRGEHAAMRQRSDGVLCMVDLAGSERAHDSGVQGKHFREAVNINRSLLDLGKCISALGKPGAVAPWRNCKLTYLLQNYLGTKGGKMLMLVTVSNQEEHISESINSLRFAKCVNQTVVGASVRRVSNF